MPFSSKTIEILNKPLDVHTRAGPGGSKFEYHKGEDVIRALNDAFGHRWSSRVVSHDIVEDQIVVLLELAVGAQDDAGVIVHQAFGGAHIARDRNKGLPVDLGNSHKSAFTNALKKAAEQFGVGLGADDEGSSQPSSSPKRGFTPTNNSPQNNGRGVSQYKAEANKAVSKTGSDSNGGRKPMQPLPKMESLSKMPERSPQPTPAPATPNTAAAPAKAPTPNQESNPFPLPTDGEPPVNTNQINVLERLSAMKGRSAEEMVKAALGEVDKTSFSDLTRDEAVQVIKFAHKV